MTIEFEDPDKIVKTVDLAAPVSRVWKALTDYKEFGAWFLVDLDQPFEAGGVSTGLMTHPECGDQPWLAHVERIEPERLFVFRWHDYDEASPLPVEEQPTALVTFELEPTETGCRLTITESGFLSFPDAQRLSVMRRNNEGWNEQVQNIAAYVAK